MIAQPVEAEQLQAAHYQATACNYNSSCGSTPEHEFALHQILGMLRMLGITSILDVGTGTGRALRFFKANRPDIRVLGVEPVSALRELAYESGVGREEVVEGDGTKLEFKDNTFDLVIETGVLHHVREPQRVVAEMLRVARKAIFISDTNNLGQGGALGRVVKNGCYYLGLWDLLCWVRTLGKGYVIEPNDGLWYYYTAFQHMKQLQEACGSVHVTNTRRTCRFPMFGASHVAILGIKRSTSETNRYLRHLG
jgi:SAM-dependent methyltransferase